MSKKPHHHSPPDSPGLPANVPDSAPSAKPLSPRKELALTINTITKGVVLLLATVGVISLAEKIQGHDALRSCQGVLQEYLDEDVAGRSDYDSASSLYRNEGVFGDTIRLHATLTLEDASNLYKSSGVVFDPFTILTSRHSIVDSETGAMSSLSAIRLLAGDVPLDIGSARIFVHPSRDLARITFPTPVFANLYFPPLLTEDPVSGDALRSLFHAYIFRNIDSWNEYRASGVSFSGDSGSAVLDTSGRLAGVISKGLSDFRRPYTFITPLSRNATDGFIPVGEYAALRQRALTSSLECSKEQWVGNVEM